MQFDESKINRDRKGRFAEKSVSELKKEQEIEIEDDSKVEIKPSKLEPKTKEEFFGKEYEGVKGIAAIEKLLSEQNGHVKAAFYRKEVGAIDLVWGDENGGLLHVIKRRDKKKADGIGNISGVEMVKKIPDIVEKGVFSMDEQDRMKIEKDGFRVGVAPKYFDEKVNWIVTAMEIIK